MLATEKEFLYSRLQFLIEKYSSWMKMKDPQENDEHFGNLHEIRQDMEKLKEYLESVPAGTLVIPQGKLLPCPFCGATPVLVDRLFTLGTLEIIPDERFDVCCSHSDCYLSLGAGYKLEKNKVINLWNKRASREPQTV